MRGRFFPLGIAAATALLLACQPETRDPAASAPGKPAPPKVDLSTPERALESYWAQTDWHVRLTREAVRHAQRKLPDAKAIYGAVATGDALKVWTDDRPDPERVFQRKIESIRRDSVSRVMMVARVCNITPIPEGARLAPDDERRREAGVAYAYALEKEAAGWKVAQVWEYFAHGWERVGDPAQLDTPSYPSYVWSDVSDSAAGQLKLDLSTPALALESYWAQKAWHQHLDNEALKEGLRAAASAVYDTVATGDVLKALQHDRIADWTFSDQLERAVQSIKQETPSRAVAVVRIRNVTPVPTGVKPSADEVRRRKAGVLYRYVLQREGADWQVAEAWKREDGGWRKYPNPRPPHELDYRWVTVTY